MMVRLSKLLAVGLMLWFAACTPVLPQQHPHIIVDREGYPNSDQGKRMSQEDFRLRIESIQTRVAEYIADRSQRGKPARLLVMIHGGMISQNQGLEYIQTMVDEQGLLKGTELFPIFINWDASLLNSMVDDLFLVRLGNRDPALGIITSPFVILTRLVTGLVELPVTLVHHYDTEKMQFEKWEGEHRSLGEATANGTLTLVSLPPTVATLPLLSGFGSGAWKMMRRRIDQMFAHQIRPAETLLLDPVTRPGALREFFEVIEARFGKGPTQAGQDSLPEVEVILVGHSMGTMVVNRILRDFPTLEYSRIVYLGAAASIDDFLTTVPPYLSRNPNTSFHSFSLSKKDESGEFNYFIAPRGTLLVWIDNIFEPGLSPTGKRVGFFRNRDAIGIRSRQDNQRVCDRMFFWKFVEKDGDDIPHRHGEFNDDVKIQRILEMVQADYPEQGRMPDDDIVIHHRVCIEPIDPY